MKNGVKYAIELQSVVVKSLALVDGKPESCRDVWCHKCDWFGLGNCEKLAHEWLYAEAE